MKLWAGLYHGPESLCEVQQFEEAVVTDGSCSWKTDITFQDISVGDLPHMCKLCFALYSAKKGGKVRLAYHLLPFGYVKSHPPLWLF